MKETKVEMTDTERMNALNWGNRKYPHFVENEELIWMLYQTQVLKKKLASSKADKFGFLDGPEGWYIGIVTVVDEMRRQKEWYRCPQCNKSKKNCKCKEPDILYDGVQNILYLIGDATATVKAEKAVVNQNSEEILEKGQTYAIKYHKYFSEYFGDTMVEIREAEDLDGKKAEVLLGYWDMIMVVGGGKMDKSKSDAYLLKHDLTEAEIVRYLGVSVSEEGVEVK